MDIRTDEVMVVLHDVRSAHNVGSVFRTADAIGVDRLYLCGYTPAPVDRFGRVQGEIAKTALGAEQNIVWEKCDDTKELITRLQKDGAYIVAVEQCHSARDYKETTPPRPCAFVFGNEVDGISESVCNSADAVVEIPMRGKKESLNVSVSVGIILFHFFDVSGTSNIQ